MRISSRCVIFKNNRIVLIYRNRDGEEYYVFPGGKIEEGESKEECIVRECKEELGIDIKVKKYIYEVKGTDFIQHYFLCDWVNGELGTGDEEEYSINRKGGVQIPMLIDIGKLSNMNIVSPPIVSQLLKDIETYCSELNSNLIEIIE